MRAHRTIILTLLAVVALAIPAAAAASRLIIGGSTSMLPLVQKLASAYHKAYPSLPAPAVGGGASDVGISNVSEGHFDIGDSSRDPLKTDPHGLTFTKVARDGICIITNNANRLGNLTQQKVEEIFTGSVRDWSEVPGATISGPIDLFDRDGSSGTQDAFQHIFLNEALAISPSATAELSNGLEQSSVTTDKQGIGFVSLYYTRGVNAVPYGGIACNLRNAKSGQYRGVRNFWMVTKGRPKGAARKFIEWVTSGNKVTKGIIGSSWIPIH